MSDLASPGDLPERAIRRLLPFDSLSLDHTAAVPLQRQLYAQLRYLIEERLLPAGSRLQSSRALAAELRISRTTVVSVYGQLATEGYVDFRPGARATVVDLPPPSTSDQRTRPGRRQLSARGTAMQEQPYHHGTPGQLAFHPGMPDSDYFPFGIWSRLLARRATAAKKDLFGSHDMAGFRPLREAIAGYVKVARGVRCDAEQIVITAGAQAALDLLARVLLDPGDTVWVEEPGYYGAQAAFVAAGANLHPLQVGRTGWDVELAASARPRLIYVTPASQQPLGLTMRMEQRLQLIDAAERADALIIEDDFDGEYRFDCGPIPALQGADKTGRVIYLGTFSKLLFPALRVGFMVLPKSLVGQLDVPLRITGQYPTPLMQAALADFIEGGYMTTHLKRMRRIYAARRQAFRKFSAARLSRWLTLLPGDAGISLVGELNDGGNDLALTAAARRRSLNVSPLSMHYRHGEPRRGIVMGYAALPEAAMPSAFARLEDACREALGP